MVRSLLGVALGAWARYRKLLTFHEKHGFTHEATWVKKRLQRLGLSY